MYIRSQLSTLLFRVEFWWAYGGPRLLRCYWGNGLSLVPGRDWVQVVTNGIRAVGPRVVMSLTMTFGRDRSRSDNPGDIGTVDLRRGLISSMTQKIHQVYMTFSPRQSNNINNPNI